MSKSYEQIKEELSAKIPRDVIQSRDGGGRTQLSYLAGWYVIDRLNQIFGPGMWSYTSEVNCVFNDKVNDKFSVHYIGKVRLVCDFGNGVRSDITDYGYGDGSDKYNPGKAHELAVKESVTDGLKRCAKSLGMSLGLALYSKEQENVEDEQAKPAPAPANRPTAPRNSTSAGPAPGIIGGGAPKAEAVAPVAEAVHGESEPDESSIKKQIVAKARLIVSLKKRAPIDFQQEVEARYKVPVAGTFTEQVNKLTALQAKEYLAQVSTMVQ